MLELQQSVMDNQAKKKRIYDQCIHIAAYFYFSCRSNFQAQNTIQAKSTQF